LLREGTADGKRPATSSIAVLPPEGFNSNQLQQLENIKLLSTFAHAYAFKLVYEYQDHPDGYDITDPKDSLIFTSRSANCLNKIITGAMGTLLTLNSSTNTSFSKNVSRTSLHLEFLTELFKSFNLTESAKNVLDGILTSIFRSLQDIEVSKSSVPNTLDHMLFVYYFEDIQGLPGKVVKLRVFFLHIDQEIFDAVKIGKNSGSHEKFNFHMNYTDMTFSMKDEMVTKNRPAIEKLIADIGEAKFEELSNKCSPKVVDSEKKDAN